MLLIAIFLFVFVIDATSVTPTCTDQKQNGDELGVDCGGACVNYCPATMKTPSIVWARSFQTSDTVVNAVAYIENQNTNAISNEVKYEFKLYDEERRFIAERVGSTFIGDTGSSAIFEGGIIVGNREVKYTNFRFISEPVWARPNEKFNDVRLLAEDGVVTGLDSKPKLEGSVRNESAFFNVNGIDVVGVLYDEKDNAIAVSKTFIETLSPGDRDTVTFTWREPFVGTPVKTEIIARFNPFTISN